MTTAASAGALAAAAAAAVLVLAVGALQRRAARRCAYDAMARLCERLPKCELHAHLHGSARLSTIADLAPEGVDTSCLQPIRGTDRSLESCFAIFGAIHQTVTNVAAVRRITLEVLADFAADGVKYLELRTTPRALGDADAAGYVDCVLGAFTEFEQQQRADGVPWPLVPRLILSVDRTGSREAALATARLAVACAKRGRYVVGVDFSGNPTRGSFADVLPAFEEARREGLGTAVHVAEVVDKADTDAVLAFRPDRLGHALTLTPLHIETLRSRPVSIEICPTSNMKTLRLQRLTEHPTLRVWLEAGYPISINTDDSTVFETTASRELHLVAEAYALSPEALVALAVGALKHTFDPDAARMRQLQRRFREEAEGALAEYYASLA